MKSYEQRKNALLSGHDASEWLKRAVLTLDKRDSVDAQFDANTLLALQRLRVAELLGLDD